MGFQNSFRLIAEKINKVERKNDAEIVMLAEGEETTELWACLNVADADDVVITVSSNISGEPKLVCPYFQDHISSNWKPWVPRLYQVGLGMGYLELPQVELPKKKLVKTLLSQKNVYLLDCYNDVFIW